MHNFVLQGETVKLYAEFRGFEGGYITPDNLTLKVIDSQGTALLETDITSHYQIGRGRYCYDFTVPTNTLGELVYEYKGYINGSPIVVKKNIEIVDYIPNLTQPTLYGV